MVWLASVTGSSVPLVASARAVTVTGVRLVRSAAAPTVTSKVALPLSTIWYTDTYFFSVFLAWGIKAMVLKLGGAKFYQRTRPFFIGIILGEVVCAGGWVVVDYVTGMTGNIVF